MGCRAMGHTGARRPPQVLPVDRRGARGTRAAHARLDHVCRCHGAAPAPERKCLMTAAMNQMDDYVRQVVNRMPRGTPQRSQIERELKSTIAERLEQGQPIDHVLRQLGDPTSLAQSY